MYDIFIVFLYNYKFTIYWTKKVLVQCDVKGSVCLVL